MINGLPKNGDKVVLTCAIGFAVYMGLKEGDEGVVIGTHRNDLVRVEFLNCVGMTMTIHLDHLRLIPRHVVEWSERLDLS